MKPVFPKADTPHGNLLSGAMIALYGLTEGVRVADVLWPSLLNDLRATLLPLAPGTERTENYRTEDEKAVITLRARRCEDTPETGTAVRVPVAKDEAGAVCELLALLVNDEEVPLSGAYRF